MTSLGGAQQYSPLPTNQPERKTSGPLVWTAIAIVAVVVVLVGGFAMRSLLKGSDGVATDNPEGAITQNSPQSAVTPLDAQNATPDQLKGKSTSSPAVGANTVQPSPETKSPTPVEATLQADPVLFPTENRVSPTPGNSATVDSNFVFRASEVDSRARLLEKPEPTYTEAARKNQVTGTVILRVVFSSTGSVTNISVIRGLPDGLNERAIAAARQIRFVPATKDGRAVSMWMQLEYNFNLY